MRSFTRSQTLDTMGHWLGATLCLLGVNACELAPGSVTSAFDASTTGTTDGGVDAATIDADTIESNSRDASRVSDRSATAESRREGASAPREDASVTAGDTTEHSTRESAGITAVTDASLSTWESAGSQTSPGSSLDASTGDLSLEQSGTEPDESTAGETSDETGDVESGPQSSSSTTGPNTDGQVTGTVDDSSTSDTSEPEPEEYLPFANGPGAGNAAGTCMVPQEARLEDVSQPDHVVGAGTPDSCTADAFINAVAQGGAITFNCGPEPVVITLDRPAKVYNDASPVVTIDGGGLVTLDGGDTTRILYMNTCDENQHWTTSHCDNQDHPRLTVQNLTFVNGNSTNETQYAGGGAIYASGGRFKVINSRFFNNRCAEFGQDLGGAGVRVLEQFQRLPAYVVNTTFGGAPELGNVCSNGGGISSIGVSWTVLNSLFSYNHAIGEGGNPAENGTLGGGSGGAIYNDGGTMTLTVCGSLLEHNQVNAYGSSIFFVSNNHDGTLVIQDSVSRNNTGGGWDPILPGISMHEDTRVSVDANSIVE